jgi:hypothetical protein
LIDPKLQKLIDRMKAKERSGLSWLERNWSWVACALSFATGLLVGRLL